MAPIGYTEIVLALLCFIILWSIRRKGNNLPLNWPFFGMVPYLPFYVPKAHEVCTRFLVEAGGTFLFKGLWLANMDILFTVEPENVHYIMSANFANFPKGPDFKKFFDVLGDGIFNSDMDSWKKQRKIARTLITHQNFHKYLVKTSQEKVENGLIPVLEHVSDSVQVIDIQDLFQRLTFDTTSILVTGYDPGCLSLELEDVPFSRAMDDAEEAILMRHVVPESLWKVQKWLGFGEEKKLQEAWKVLDHVIGDYISLKKEDLKKGSKSEKDEHGADLLTSYLNESGNMELKCDDKFLRDTILNLMLAGRDTTSSALTWLVWLVKTHPAVEARINDELSSVIRQEKPENSKVFNVRHIDKLVYLHGAICESLRLYPPVPFQHKEPIESDILPSGHKVNPKMKIVFSLYAMGRMESIWGKDCLEFKPERWISEKGTIKHEPSYKFLAFNAGPRTCLGRDVAFTQIKVVAATLFHNYQIHIVEGQKFDPNVSIILYMKHGLKVMITKRE